MRRRLRLALGSLAASLWFAAVFFAGLPALILWASGRLLWPAPGPALWIGLAIAVAAHARVFRHVSAFVSEGDGTPVPFHPPQHLVRSGAYRRVRNPMYLLYVAVILGEALAWRSPALALYAGAFWLLAHAYVVGREEPLLRRRFGPAYAEYCERVPRWLPGRRPETRRPAARRPRDRAGAPHSGSAGTGSGAS